MISILAKNPLHERFIREMLKPLGQSVAPHEETPSLTEAPELAVIWWEGAAADKKTTQSAELLCEQARRTIILAANADAALSARTLGPDAIFTAPFRPGQVSARVRTFLNPAAADRLPVQISLGPYVLYPRENRVHHEINKQDLRLTDKERDILLTLKAAAGKPVSRQDLLDHVWAYAPDVETHTLETHIYRLRQKIEEDPAAPQIVLTDEAGYKILVS